MKTIVCVLLIATVFGSSLRGFNSQRQKKKVLNFSNVFAQVKSMLATEGPYSDVYALLDDIKAQLLAEQAAQLAVYLDQSADCSAELDLRAGEMAEATTANAASVSAYNACFAAEAEAVVAHGAVTQTLQNKQSQLAAETNLRANQAALFVMMEADYARQLANIGLAVDYVNSLDNTVSTEQMQPYLLLPQLSSKLALSAISTNSFEALIPIFMTMSALAGQDYGVVGAEGDAVGELLALLTELQTDTQTTLDQLRQEESDRINAFATNSVTLSGLIGQLTDEQAEIAAHQFEMETCMSVEVGIQAAAQAKFTRNEGIHGATLAMCDLFEREYQDSEAARQQEIVLLDALSELVREELSGVVGSGITRGDSDQDDWEDHDPEEGYDYDNEDYSG